MRSKTPIHIFSRISGSKSKKFVPCYQLKKVCFRHYFCQILALLLHSKSATKQGSGYAKLQYIVHFFVLGVEKVRSQNLIIGLKRPNGQIRSVREWYHKIGLGQDIPDFRFSNFYYFDLGLLNRVQNSIALYAQIYLITNSFRDRQA